MKTDELHAWKPWIESLSAFKYLACLESPGDFKHWRIYWAGVLTLLVTVRDVLDRTDRRKSDLHSQIIHDFLKQLATRKEHHPLYWKFVRSERNSLVHEFSLSAKEHRVTSYTAMDRGLSYEQLVQKYGERKMLTWGDEDEDGLRLLELALNWWELNLRIIEQAVRDNENCPFSSRENRRNDLINASFKHRGHFDYSWERGSIDPAV